ncbi:MAG: hypothetical protein ACPGVG_17965 [Mycobacterium sp.]
MATYRTVAQAQEEYDAVRAAYLKALKGENVSVSTGSGSFSTSRPAANELRQQMLDLEREIARMTRGGIRVRGATPVG